MKKNNNNIITQNKTKANKTTIFIFNYEYFQ